MAIVTKKIKAKRLNEKAMQRALAEGMNKTGKEMKKEFEKTTKTWKNKPVFEIIEAVTPEAGKIEVGVFTDNEIYRYVNDGTEPHIITPKKQGGKLAFKWAGPGSYKAKTSPRVIGSSSGGSSGKQTVLPYVFHPGTEAREFDETIAEYMQPRFKREMEKAMSDAAKASGHKI